MIAGDNIAGRYEIEESIGSGGMGAIYRARDLETGMRVAIKVLLGEGWESRLEMEARVLAELRHPRIVRYVGHGVTAEGSPFLAMQWLEGEDLAKRMDAGGGLSAQESIHVAINVAEALAAGHARGVLHRDVKPSNVFLREGEVDHLVLIDYGLARRTQGGRRLTQTGSVLGTPEYMAPEQAKGERDIDARVDVYALGCVLFECLTGRTPFAAEHAIAVLGKVLLETAPRLRSLRPEMPEELDELIARMLSKNRDERPRDGEDALSLLRGLAPVHASPVRPASIPPLSITHGEQRLMSVIFARPTTWLDEPLLDRLHQLVVEEGDALQALADGSILVALPGKGTATDQAARASRVAIELRAAISSTVALATGRGVLAHGWPVGEALDRAAAMLGQVESSGLVLDAPVVDKLTAALLDSRYTVRNEGPFTVLERGERSAAGRTVLGRETPFVGRERVMRDLAATIEGCLRDETSGVVVVTAAPGVGKSRLLRELAASLRSSHPELAVWFAHGEAAHAG